MTIPGKQHCTRKSAMNTLMASGPLPRIRCASNAPTARVSSPYPRKTKKYCPVIRRRSRTARKAHFGSLSRATLFSRKWSASKVFANEYRNQPRQTARQDSDSNDNPSLWPGAPFWNIRVIDHTERVLLVAARHHHFL
jgi:hypothetical protein